MKSDVEQNLELRQEQKVKQTVKQAEKSLSGLGRYRTYDQSVMSRSLCH